MRGCGSCGDPGGETGGLGTDILEKKGLGVPSSPRSARRDTRELLRALRFGAHRKRSLGLGMMGGRWVWRSSKGVRNSGGAGQPCPCPKILAGWGVGVRGGCVGGWDTQGDTRESSCRNSTGGESTAASFPNRRFFPTCGKYRECLGCLMDVSSGMFPAADPLPGRGELKGVRAQLPKCCWKSEPKYSMRSS